MGQLFCHICELYTAARSALTVEQTLGTMATFIAEMKVVMTDEQWEQMQADATAFSKELQAMKATKARLN